MEEESEAAVDYKDWSVNTILDVSTSEGKGILLKQCLFDSYIPWEGTRSKNLQDNVINRQIKILLGNEHIFK